jgi:hypothetical protein
MDVRPESIIKNHKIKISCVSELHLRVVPAVISKWPSKRKLDEEKSKHVGLAHQNGFGLAFFHRMHSGA